MPPCQIFAQLLGHGSMELDRVSLTDGSSVTLMSNPANLVFASPQLSPRSGDVVVQVGGEWGHLQTFATAVGGDLFSPFSDSNLHLYQGLVQ